MSNQIFAGAGSIDVFPSHLRVNPGGATIAWLKNANDGDVGAGLAVVLEGGLKDGELAGDYDAFKYSIVSSTSAASAAAVLSRVWGLTLEDIPAGEYGAVMLRGSAMATCTDAGQNLGGYYNALISPGGVGTDGHLVSVADAGSGVFFKAIAIYRGVDIIDGSPVSSASSPVLFNGVEGFGSGYLP